MPLSLRDKSKNILELPTVLSLLANEAVCDSAKEKALSLLPSSIVYEVGRKLCETSDAKKLMTLKGSPVFYSIREVRGSLSRATLGGMLNTRELLDIALVLRCARQVKAYGGESETSAISPLFARLRGNKYLEDKITISISGEDEISDAASSELASIRRHIRASNSKVREILQKIISSSSNQKVLQEPIITMRSDRYVIPVRAEYKNSIPGLVHDISSSGATLFIEPIQVVQANNEVKELEAKEKAEIERILMELSGEAANFEGDIALDFDILVSLDLIFAKAKLSYALNCIEPEISENGRVVLKRARHPLLPHSSVVPIDIAIGEAYDTLVITGPNTGGKTVSIKTLGLLCLMSQCGLHIPCDYGSTVPVFENILADIGDEQSIEQSLSTFSSHMTNIVGILKEAKDNTLLLFDELGAGTDPVEGAALAVSIIEHARKLGAKLALTTHYAELKIYATSTEGVLNASCEFNVETLKPTYRLLMGIPGKSNAFDISLRLGLEEGIVRDAKQRVDSGSADFEDVLALLQKQRQEMEREELRTRQLLIEAEENSRKSEELRKYLESEREKATKIAKREAEQIIQNARRTAEKTFADLNEMRKRLENQENIQAINEARAAMMRDLNEAESSFINESEKVKEYLPIRPIKEGDTVEILKIGTKAEVISISADRTLSLQAGIMKVSVKESEVRLIGSAPADMKKRAEKTEAQLRSLTVKPEIDIRGLATDEAIATMENYLDSAFLANLNTVTIIHGKGTGALRAAVQASLKKNRGVKSFRLGKYGEGEHGVTIVDI